MTTIKTSEFPSDYSNTARTAHTMGTLDPYEVPTVMRKRAASTPMPATPADAGPSNAELANTMRRIETRMLKCFAALGVDVERIK